jgi:5-methylthioadenosine/S-adenosylhomocysteine deaminase
VEADIGMLEPGKWADLCCIDPGVPDGEPCDDPVTELVFRGGRDMVSDVWVAGRPLLAEGELIRLDSSAVAARARAWTLRLQMR